MLGKFLQAYPPAGGGKPSSEPVVEGLSDWGGRDPKRSFVPAWDGRGGAAARRQRGRAGRRYGNGVDGCAMAARGAASAGAATGGTTAAPAAARDRRRALLRAARRGRAAPNDPPPRGTVGRGIATGREGGAVRAAGPRPCRGTTAGGPAAAPRRRQACSTAKASRRRKGAARAAATPAGRSGAASAVRRSTRTGRAPSRSRTRPARGTTMGSARGLPPAFIEKVFAAAGRQGPRVATATRIAVETVRDRPGRIGFAGPPPSADGGPSGRIIRLAEEGGVERVFARIDRNRRLWKDAKATGARLPPRRSRHDPPAPHRPGPGGSETGSETAFWVCL